MLDSVAIVILAAGESKRFGSPKQLAQWNAKPLMQNMVDVLNSLGVTPYLALGAFHDQIMQTRNLDLSSCVVIHVDGWQEGVGASIRRSVGLIAQKREYEGILFFLADQPLLNERAVKEIFLEVFSNLDKMVCCRYPSTIGVPAYFPRRYFDQLAALKGDKGAKAILKSGPYISLELGESLFDIDEPEDLAHAEAICSGKLR